MVSRYIILLAGQLQHKGEGILSARQRDQYLVIMGEQVLVSDPTVDLLGEKFKETACAQANIMAGQGNNGSGMATFAFHTAFIPVTTSRGKPFASEINKSDAGRQLYELMSAFKPLRSRAI